MCKPFLENVHDKKRSLKPTTLDSTPPNRAEQATESPKQILLMTD